MTSGTNPPNPCLASRIPYGSAISKEKLGAVESGEAFLVGNGFSDVRVRHHGSIARIEVPPSDIERIAGEENRKKIVEHFKKLGFLWVTVDLEGYRTGSLNEMLLRRDRNMRIAAGLSGDVDLLRRPLLRVEVTGAIPSSADRSVEPRLSSRRLGDPRDRVTLRSRATRLGDHFRAEPTTQACT